MAMDEAVVCKQEQVKKIEKVANWVKSSLASAFFASLERCSCINLATIDEEVEECANTSLAESDGEHIRQSHTMEKWAHEEAPLQSWANQTLPYMSSPHGMARFT
eukprot:c12412_g1_i1 orf=74-388(+)